MDQVKLVLAVILKYHFWVLCCVVTLVGLAVYATASTDLAAQFQERKDALEGQISRVQNIGASGAPPNQAVIDAKKSMTALLRLDVLRAWEMLRQEQKEKNPWPAELGENFLSMVNSLGPEEVIPREHLEVYWDFIEFHLPAVYDIIDRRRQVWVNDEGKIVGEVARPGTASAFDGGAGGSSATVGLTRKWVGIVDWLNPEVQTLGSWVSCPKTYQVRLAQEDLWVYEALLYIIADTNAGATSHYNAAIKRIDALQIGRAAAGLFSATAGGFGGDEGEEEEEEEDDDDEDDDAGGSAGPVPGIASVSLSAKAMDNRYVDREGEPVAHDQQPFAEFRWMPVRMRLLIDQKKIPDLLVNCANSSMPVEIRRVTFFPGESGLSGATFGGDEDDGGGGFGQRPSSGSASNNTDIPIEIQGIIQIFNYPDREKLGTGLEAERTAEAGQTPAATEPVPPGDADAAPAPAEETIPDTEAPADPGAMQPETAAVAPGGNG